jgi:hypothetical protein
MPAQTSCGAIGGDILAPVHASTLRIASALALQLGLASAGSGWSPARVGEAPRRIHIELIPATARRVGSVNRVFRRSRRRS